MWMTEREIVHSYRMAKNQKLQIEILATINDCSMDEIKNVLVEAKEIEADKPQKDCVGEVLNTQRAESEEKEQAKKPSKPQKDSMGEATRKTTKTSSKKAKSIPIAIKKYAFERLDELEKQIAVYERQKKALEQEYQDIAEFLGNDVKKLQQEE